MTIESIKKPLFSIMKPLCFCKSRKHCMYSKNMQYSSLGSELSFLRPSLGLCGMKVHAVQNTYMFKTKTVVTLCNAAWVRASRNTRDSWHVASEVMFGQCTSRNILLFSIFHACPLCSLGHGLQFKGLSQRLSHDESAPRHRQGLQEGP